MAAAVAGIELTELEVVATSQSDARGLLGMADADGQPVSAGPLGLQLHVKITATGGTSAERLRSLVERSHGCSPVSCALEAATAIELLIKVG
jgi:uroporphyrinogen-III synthase